MHMLSLDYDLIIARHYVEMRLKEASLGTSLFESQVEGKPFDKRAYREEIRRDCTKKRKFVISEDFCIECHPNYHTARDTSSHERHSISMLQFDDWQKHFKNAEFVKARRQRAQKLFNDLSENGHLDPINYDVEMLITPEMYALIYEKIWATIRFDILRELANLTPEMRQEFTIKNTIDLCSQQFEDIRTEIVGMALNQPNMGSCKARIHMK